MTTSQQVPDPASGDAGGLDALAVLALVEESVTGRHGAEVALLTSAAGWADLHGDHAGVTRGQGATDDEWEKPRSHSKFRKLGGVGTPVVAEFASAELAVSLRVHPTSARMWMADALDLRHRLPRLWALAVAGDIRASGPVWVLRKIALRTRHLPEDAADLIDEELAPLVGSLPTARLLEKLESLVVLAEEALGEEQRRRNRRERFVAFNQSTRAGLKGLYAKLAAADAIVGDAQIQRLAELLLAGDLAAGVAESELDSISAARSRALGLLIADPEKALSMLRGHLPVPAERTDLVDQDEAPSDDSSEDNAKESAEPDEPPREEAGPDSDDAQRDDADRDDAARREATPETDEAPEDADEEADPEPDETTDPRNRDHSTPTRSTPCPGRAAKPRPRVVLHLHLADDALEALAAAKRQGRRHASGVARLEGQGPLTLAEALDVLELGDVTITPVVDPRIAAPVDSYEFTGTLREAVLSRRPTDVYPYATAVSHHVDIDHTAHYRAQGPPGQTALANAGPMTRHHHRIKTHGPMDTRQPLAGVHVWRTRHGRYRYTDHTGTHDLDEEAARGLFGTDPLEHEHARLLLLDRLGRLDTNPAEDDPID